MQNPSLTSPTLEQAVAAQLAGQMLESPLVYEQVLQEDPAMSGFCLHASGRYRHSDDHVRHNLARNGLSVLHLSTELLRHEAALPVEGRLVVARKTRHPQH